MIKPQICISKVYVPVITLINMLEFWLPKYLFLLYFIMCYAATLLFLLNLPYVLISWLLLCTNI